MIEPSDQSQDTTSESHKYAYSPLRKFKHLWRDIKDTWEELFLSEPVRELFATEEKRQIKARAGMEWRSLPDEEQRDGERKYKATLSVAKRVTNAEVQRAGIANALFVDVDPARVFDDITPTLKIWHALGLEGKEIPDWLRWIGSIPLLGMPVVILYSWIRCLLTQPWVGIPKTIKAVFGLLRSAFKFVREVIYATIDLVEWVFRFALLEDIDHGKKFLPAWARTLLSFLLLALLFTGVGAAVGFISLQSLQLYPILVLAEIFIGYLALSLFLLTIGVRKEAISYAEIFNPLYIIALIPWVLVVAPYKAFAKETAPGDRWRYVVSSLGIGMVTWLVIVLPVYRLSKLLLGAGSFSNIKRLLITLNSIDDVMMLFRPRRLAALELDSKRRLEKKSGRPYVNGSLSRKAKTVVRTIFTFIDILFDAIGSSIDFSSEDARLKAQFWLTIGGYGMIMTTLILMKLSVSFFVSPYVFFALGGVILLSALTADIWLDPNASWLQKIGAIFILLRQLFLPKTSADRVKVWFVILLVVLSFSAIPYLFSLPILSPMAMMFYILTCMFLVIMVGCSVLDKLGYPVPSPSGDWREATRKGAVRPMDDPRFYMKEMMRFGSAVNREHQSGYLPACDIDDHSVIQLLEDQKYRIEPRGPVLKTGHILKKVYEVQKYGALYRIKCIYHLDFSARLVTGQRTISLEYAYDGSRYCAVGTGEPGKALTGAVSDLKALHLKHLETLPENEATRIIKFVEITEKTIRENTDEHCVVAFKGRSTVGIGESEEWQLFSQWEDGYFHRYMKEDLEKRPEQSLRVFNTDTTYRFEQDGSVTIYNEQERAERKWEDTEEREKLGRSAIAPYLDAIRESDKDVLSAVLDLPSTESDSPIIELREELQQELQIRDSVIVYSEDVVTVGTELLQQLAIGSNACEQNKEYASSKVLEVIGNADKGLLDPARDPNRFADAVHKIKTALKSEVRAIEKALGEDWEHVSFDSPQAVSEVKATERRVFFSRPLRVASGSPQFQADSNSNSNSNSNSSSNSNSPRSISDSSVDFDPDSLSRASELIKTHQFAEAIRCLHSYKQRKVKELLMEGIVALFPNDSRQSVRMQLFSSWFNWKEFFSKANRLINGLVESRKSELVSDRKLNAACLIDNYRFDEAVKELELDGCEREHIRYLLGEYICALLPNELSKQSAKCELIGQLGWDDFCVVARKIIKESALRCLASEHEDEKSGNDQSTSMFPYHFLRKMLLHVESGDLSLLIQECARYKEDTKKNNDRVKLKIRLAFMIEVENDRSLLDLWSDLEKRIYQIEASPPLAGIDYPAVYDVFLKLVQAKQYKLLVGLSNLFEVEKYPSVMLAASVQQILRLIQTQQYQCADGFFNLIEYGENNTVNDLIDLLETREVEKQEVNKRVAVQMFNLLRDISPVRLERIKALLAMYEDDPEIVEALLARIKNGSYDLGGNKPLEKEVADLDISIEQEDLSELFLETLRSNCFGPPKPQPLSVKDKQKCDRGGDEAISIMINNLREEDGRLNAHFIYSLIQNDKAEDKAEGPAAAVAEVKAADGVVAAQQQEAEKPEQTKEAKKAQAKKFLNRISKANEKGLVKIKGEITAERKKALARMGGGDHLRQQPQIVSVPEERKEEVPKFVEQEEDLRMLFARALQLGWFGDTKREEQRFLSPEEQQMLCRNREKDFSPIQRIIRDLREKYAQENAKFIYDLIFDRPEQEMGEAKQTAEEEQAKLNEKQAPAKGILLRMFELQGDQGELVKLMRAITIHRLKQCIKLQLGERSDLEDRINQIEAGPLSKDINYSYIYEALITLLRDGQNLLLENLLHIVGSKDAMAVKQILGLIQTGQYQYAGGLLYSISRREYEFVDNLLVLIKSEKGNMVDQLFSLYVGVQNADKKEEQYQLAKALLDIYQKNPDIAERLLAIHERNAMTMKRLLVMYVDDVEIMEILLAMYQDDPETMETLLGMYQFDSEVVRQLLDAANSQGNLSAVRPLLARCQNNPDDVQQLLCDYQDNLGLLFQQIQEENNKPLSDEDEPVKERKEDPGSLFMQRRPRRLSGELYRISIFVDDPELKLQWKLVRALEMGCFGPFIQAPANREQGQAPAERVQTLISLLENEELKGNAKFIDSWITYKGAYVSYTGLANQQLEQIFAAKVFDITNTRRYEEIMHDLTHETMKLTLQWKLIKALEAGYFGNFSTAPPSEEKNMTLDERIVALIKLLNNWQLQGNAILIRKRIVENTLYHRDVAGQLDQIFAAKATQNSTQYKEIIHNLSLEAAADEGLRLQQESYEEGQFAWLRSPTPPTSPTNVFFN